MGVEWSRERSSVSRDHKRFFMCPIIEVKSMALPPLHTINTKVVSYHDTDDVQWKLRCERRAAGLGDSFARQSGNSWASLAL